MTGERGGALRSNSCQCQLPWNTIPRPQQDLTETDLMPFAEWYIGAAATGQSGE